MSASQPAYFNLQEFSDIGAPLVGGRLYTYAQGTTALKTAYTDPAGAIPHTYTADGLGGQYIALNARGELPAPIYLAAGPYDMALKRGDGSTVWTRRADPTGDVVTSLRTDLSAPGGAGLVGRGAGTVDTSLTSLEASSSALGNRATSLEAIVTGSGGHPSRPAYIEQHITGFFGRGMLTAEPINIATEQAFTSDAALGATVVAVANSSAFTVGGCCAIKHDNGLYASYFIGSIGSGTLGIYPSLRYACTVGASRVERTWYNRAHPGKFYMRSLAQRIARGLEFNESMPNGNRVLFTNVSSIPNTLEDTLTTIGGANVAYFPAENLGESGTVASPVRFITGRSAYVDNITGNSNGVETQYFNVDKVALAIVKLSFMAHCGSTSFSIQVFDELDVERAKFVIPNNENSRAAQIYTLPANLRSAKRIKVRVASEFYVNTGYFVVDQIDIFEAPELSGKIISKKSARIVCLGDSWTAGDTGSTPERESICTQLAIELPNATIINAGVGGNKITDMLARFDADVTPYNPDYVVVETGTNEAYSPLSGVFDPTAITDFLAAYARVLHKIAVIGARPIIIGVPALSQSDADVPGFAEWLLNDRSKAYARYFFEWQSVKPFVQTGSNANGTWTKYADGTLICRNLVSVTTTAANTLAGTAWAFPVPFFSAPVIETTPSGYSTNQLLATGYNGAITISTNIYMVSGSSGITVLIGCTAVGRWFA